MEKIEIKNFITINILELNEEECVYFVDSYNEKYFYINNNELCTYQKNYTVDIYTLYFQKAEIIHRDNLNILEKEVYRLYRKLTVSIPRAEKDKYYYFIDTNFKVIKIPEEYDHFDNSQYNSFNYFLTEEEATKYAKKLQQFLIESRKEDYLKGE